jgi:hypothetical protein
MVGITVFVMFVFVGVSFKSIMVPLRGIVTIALTLAFTYGAVTLIYNVRVARAALRLGYV